ncbi:hypothetical protein [Sporichthya polymorpha]|uniref:hypothetical protein n=1 Tax=Sporichthya polymorpha TaxID=35751 RepID=UPI00037E9950|nr:hypothetical protein [Sporichthya polymorpha]
MFLRVVVTSAALALTSLVPVPAVAALGSSPDRVAIREAKAERLAKAAVLRRRDLPGYSVQEQSRTSALEKDAARYECLGVEAPSYAARHDGRAFTKRPSQIGSRSVVLGTPERARADLARLATVRGVDCYGQALTALFTEQGAEVRRVLIEQVPVDVGAASLAIGFRYEVQARLEGAVVRIRGIDLHAQVGAAEVIVTSVRPDGRWPSLGQVERLAGRAAQRVARV